MTEALGTVRSYDDLQAVCRAVADMRQMSREEIDRIAGWAPGLAAKFLSVPPVRKMGGETIKLMLGAIGLQLLAVDDPASLAKFTARASKRNQSQVRVQSAAVEIKISRRKLKQIGRKGGTNSRKNMSKRKATALARRANRARWHKPLCVASNKSSAIVVQCDCAISSSPQSS